MIDEILQYKAVTFSKKPIVLAQKKKRWESQKTKSN
jgi:hypothetical protein